MKVSELIGELIKWDPEQEIGIATQGGLGLSYYGTLYKVDVVPITYREDVTCKEFTDRKELPRELAIIAKHLPNWVRHEYPEESAGV